MGIDIKTQSRSIKAVRVSPPLSVRGGGGAKLAIFAEEILQIGKVTDYVFSLTYDISQRRLWRRRGNQIEIIITDQDNTHHQSTVRQIMKKWGEGNLQGGNTTNKGQDLD